MNIVENITKWLILNIANIIVLAIIATGIALAIKSLIKAKKAGCKGECIGCSAAYLCNRDLNNNKNPIVEAYYQAHPKN